MSRNRGRPLTDGVGGRPEYVIHAKVKNNLLLSRILATAESVGAFCRNNNLDPTSVGGLVNMTRVAFSKTKGRWTKLAVDLSEILGCLPEDLFSEEQRYLELRTNAAFVAMTREQIEASFDLQKYLEDAEVVREVIDHTHGLTPVGKRVLKALYLEDKTLSEAAREFGRSVNSVLLAERKALRRIRLVADQLTRATSDR